MKKDIQQIHITGSLAKKLKTVKKERPYVKVIKTRFEIGTLAREDSLRVMRAKWRANKQEDLWPRKGPLANVKIASMDEVAKYDTWVNGHHGVHQKGVPRTGAAAKGVPKKGAAAKGVPKTGAAAKGVPKKGAAAKGMPKPGAGAKGMPKPGAGRRGNRSKKCVPHPGDLRVLSAVKSMEALDAISVLPYDTPLHSRPMQDPKALIPLLFNGKRKRDNRFKVHTTKVAINLATELSMDIIRPLQALLTFFTEGKSYGFLDTEFLQKTVDDAFVYRKEGILKARPGLDAIFFATGEAAIPFKYTYLNKAIAASRRNIVLTALLSEVPHLSKAMERGVTIWRLIEEGISPPPCPGHPAYKNNIQFVPMSFRDLCLYHEWLFDQEERTYLRSQNKT
jgi:hypothetical protein